MINQIRLNEGATVPQQSKQRLENFPPFKSMQVKVLELDELWQRVVIQLPLNPHNSNPGGTMFGGAMTSLADPIAALACAKRFPEYTVWTKSLTVDFLRPGSQDLQLVFDFPAETMGKIEQDLAKRNASTPEFEYGFYLDETLCCRVHCQVAIRPADPESHRRGFRNKDH